MIGQTISHYKILEKLGEGGMGVVYKAQDTKLNRLVALKFLPQQVRTSESDKARFLQEAQAAAALNHPNICTIHGIEEHDSGTFIVMEYVDGETIRKKLETGSMKLETVISHAIQIAEALREAHSKGIVHRDIKPDNIMLTSKGQVKVTDFGLAKLRGSLNLTRTSTTVGTLGYMSPEQVQGGKVDASSDLFSFGILLFEMLTGRLPFRGEHEAALVYSIVNENPEPVKKYRPDIPASIEIVINRCLEKEKEKRFHDAGEIVGSLLPGQVNAATTARVWNFQKMRVYGVVALVIVATATIYVFFKPKAPLVVESKSIAVLPFINVGGNPDDEYFSDGITDDIITHLSKIGSFKVISRTSSMLYKDKKKPIRQVAKELDVGTVLEGTVRRIGNRVRVNSQLVDSRTEENLWAESYDRELSDIFSIQEDISRNIAHALQATLSPIQETGLSKKPTQSLDAYNLYLLGIYQWNKQTPDGFNKALEYFRQALTIDPNYAVVHAKVAETYVLFVFYSFLSPKDAFPKAKDAITKALDGDKRLAEAHISLALYKGFHEWDWEGSEKEFLRALEINPNSSSASFWYAYFLTFYRGESAVERWKQLLLVDPLSLLSRTELGYLYYMTRDYDKAIAQFQEVIKIEPTYFDSYHHLGWTYVQKGIFKEAITAHETAVRLIGGSDVTKGGLGYAYAMAGERKKARDILISLVDESKKRYVPSYQIAIVLVGLGEKDKALEWLQKAYAERDVWLPILKIEPAFDPLRSDPHYKLLLEKMRLER